MGAGKGDKYRRVDYEKFSKGWDLAFKKKPTKKKTKPKKKKDK